MILSEYWLCQSLGERLVEIIVGFLSRSLALRQLNNSAPVRAVLNSVPKSSIISKSTVNIASK